MSPAAFLYLGSTFGCKYNRETKFRKHLEKMYGEGYTVAVNMFVRSRRSQAVTAMQVRETGCDDFSAKAEIVFYRKDVGSNEEEVSRHYLGSGNAGDYDPGDRVGGGGC